MGRPTKRSVKDGERFGKLVVIRFDHSSIKANGKKGERVLLCKCDCGNTIAVRTGNLRSGNTRSCGCLKTETLIKTNKARRKLSKDET